MSEQQSRSTIDRLSAWGWHVGLQLLFWSGGGLLIVGMEPPGPAGVKPASGVLLSTLLVGLLMIGGAGLRLRARKRGKWVGFSTLLHVAVLATTAAAAEWVARSSAPDWPARDLHGVSPDDWARAQSPMSQTEDRVGINSWGQRDREREGRPPEGTLRIACIGDSFLEEGSAQPVSLLIEQQLGRDDVEVVNLGVSATGPDEYYDRTCRVAMPIGAGHCLLFVYAGNDFAPPPPPPPRSLESWAGIAAVSPRPSLLRACGLEGVNHVLTNQRRPVIQAWFAAGDLAAREQALHQIIVRANDEQLRHALLNADVLPAEDRARLAEQLWRPEMAGFFEVLRHPDAGRFRSYYLSAGLWSASVGGGVWDRNSPDAALYWVEQAVNACRDAGVELTVVIVPDGFQVDPRLVDQWSPLADMRRLTAPTRDAAEEFREQALARGWDVLDLHESLDGVEGAYLNLDGHWSPVGATAAAAAVVEHLKTRHGL